MKYLFILLLLFPVTCLAQFKISGRVINATDGKPVPDASVFLNNETIGTKSAGDGTFILSNLNTGQHDLTVSVIGYEVYHQTLMVKTDLVLPDIKLLPKTTMLGEVKIELDPRREKKLKEFTQQFLGSSGYARQCEIVNPDVLTLKYNRDGNVLTGSSDDFLEINNNALGYKLKYLITRFVVDRNENKLIYEGAVLFEELDGNDNQVKQWKSNRMKVYYGSPTHFLREILADRVDSGYSVETKKIISSYVTVKGFTGNKSTSRTALQPADYVHRTDTAGIFALGYNTPLEVYYKPRKARGKAANTHPQYATIGFIDPYLYFDGNGTILNPMGVVFNYAWGNSRVAQLLPIDYWPNEN
ncbi:carboxypeptidase-like regulatory domain-containing protein [Mucilaginibacter sp. 14171R-50]|uniref:carboxypeptidase-like regulatory domain-containing protein n=1 Tax=Mucilaginibacter sp. 14171R-50 TaxID=2703789 RepID=UPI00138BCB0C|nr:carboxypeptidase-like regulatory domain-containing protein [Mucilaginibacter sp. 14171R-50]QHS55668.1 carboxypeptidase-like regulatory domain-containing protein [Mucilaginibacter sp. 14171R-50]